MHCNPPINEWRTSLVGCGVWISGQCPRTKNQSNGWRGQMRANLRHGGAKLRVFLIGLALLFPPLHLFAQLLPLIHSFLSFSTFMWSYDLALFTIHVTFITSQILCIPLVSYYAHHAAHGGKRLLGCALWVWAQHLPSIKWGIQSWCIEKMHLDWDFQVLLKSHATPYPSHFLDLSQEC